jgi:hypothetical protein
MMVVMKEARLIKTPKWDTYVDIVGYVNTVDMMCRLYCEVSHSYDYDELSEESKELLLKEIKSLSFSDQYDLLITTSKRLKGITNDEIF